MVSFFSSTRRMIGLALVVVSAVAAVWSSFLTWYGSRDGTNIRVSELFNGISVGTAAWYESLLWAMILSAVLVLAGIVVWWRWLWALAGAVAITTVVLWGVRQAQTLAGLHAGPVGVGPWMAAASGVGMLLASVIATSRRHRLRREPERLSPEWTPTAGTEVGRPEGTPTGSTAGPRVGK